MSPSSQNFLAVLSTCSSQSTIMSSSGPLFRENWKHRESEKMSDFSLSVKSIPFPP